MAKTPRNLRQVGNPGENLSIYIEDYVFTYLKSEYNTEAAILVGESCYEESGIKVYVRGAICCPQIFWREEGMEIAQRTWNYILREREQCFERQEIVGWYMPIPPEDESRVLISLGEFHGRYFPGIDKVFFYLDPKQGEDAFYIRDGAVFKRQTGYYVFYEKNTVMREYMLALRQERQLEADLYKEVHDKPRENVRYREYINAELDKTEKQSRGPVFVMGMVALASVIVLVVAMVAGYYELNGLESFFAAVEHALQIELDGPADKPENEDGVESIVAGAPTEDGEISGSGEQGDLNVDSQTNFNPVGELSSGAVGDGDDVANEESSMIEGTQFDEDVDEMDTEVALALAQGYYVVKQGEGLAEICRKLYGDDGMLESICQLNGIENPDSIFPGQIIYLP